MPLALHDSHSLPLRYGVAVVSAALAVLLRELLTPLWGRQLPFLTLYPAVLVSAWYGGLGPGLVTTALCATAASYFWLAPFHSLGIYSLANQVGLALAVLVMLIITHLTAALRRTQEQLQRQVHQVQAHAGELTQANARLSAEITTRQQMEQHLQERVEELETLLDILPVAVWIGHDPAGTRITGNRASYELLRMPPGSNISVSGPPAERPTHFTVHTADGAELRPAELPMQYVGTHGVVIANTEYLYRFADGTETYTYGGAKPLFDAQGQVRGSLATLLDITARKHTEMALLESETRFAIAFGHSPLALTVTSVQDGCLLEVNEGFVRLSGYTREEAVGRTVDDLNLWVNPERRLQRFAQLTAGQRVPDIEARFRLKSGEERIGVIGSALVEINGRPCVLSSIVDITARKEAEEALAQHARDLARAHADLQQVAYVSAHDLQEPVRQVGVYTQKIAKRYRDTLDPETQEAIDFIVEGTKRMQAQFTDLLHYLEMEEPGEGITTTDCELLMQHALDALRDQIATSNAIVTHDPLPTLAANAKHLQLVFLELIDNAVKFRNNAPPQVHMWAEREEGGWRFAVRDNGLGIASQSQGQLFGFFRKLQRRTEYPGTGMGLAMCKKIVDRHGGRIWVDSEPGEGTTVYFTIADRSSQ
jgi:PAS domain S-box-containing protein